MRQIPDESVGCCFADPPFNVNLNYGAGFNDKKSPKEYWTWLKERLREIYRILKNPGRLYIFCTDKGVFKLKPICESLGFNYHQMLIWYRPNLAGGRCGIKGDWHYMHEIILLFHKGKRTPMQIGISYNCFSVLSYPAPQSNFKGGRDHPAQKPVSLMKHLISRTPGNPILFPFLGSGTDTRAAKDLRRDFIGIELNPAYCSIARERLGQEVLGNQAER